MSRAILFDLDGTLVDTRTASWELFAQTNAKFNLGVDTREAFFAIFEGNFFQSIHALPVEPGRIQAAKQHFMHALQTCYCPPFIPGMADVVRALAAHSPLAVVSANTMAAIRRTLLNEQLATCFAHVFSGDLEAHKSVSIQRFIGTRDYCTKRLCSPDYNASDSNLPALEANDLVLVTDTVGDVLEAAQAGICAIGVSWGMHGEQQLLQAGAQRVALWPQELLLWLRPPTETQQVATIDHAEGSAPCQPLAHSESAAEHLELRRSGLLRRSRHLQHRQQAEMVFSNQTSTAPPQGQEQLHQALTQIMEGGGASAHRSMTLAH